MPDDPHNPDSLGDERTFVGEGDAPAGEEQSLGDGSTHAGGMDSSLSDLADLDDALDFDLPQIDLAARYEIEGELGKGGMGAVQLATDRSLQRKVAIKRIHASSPSAMKRFVTEARSIAALNHLNIVQVHEFGRDKDGPLLVLEYISGGSLLDRLKEGKLEVKDAIGITCQLCDALTLAHQKGIIHRDIKPANILLTEDGVPKLTDFGLARQDSVDHGQTQVGAVLGTIDFMPPEQRRDATATDGRSDLWSLAATLYQMITGEIPRVIDLDAVPQNLRSTFARALKQNPDDRFPTAEEFKTELRKGMATAATPVEADLVAGVCPACNTVNDASRKFCSDSTCATSLRVSCLACSQQIPIWDNVCGECGGKQPELVAARREELDAQRAKAEQLGSEFAFGEALQVAEEIGRVEDSRLQHLKAWSETFIIETTAENERQQENAANRYAEATNHYDSIDIPSAIMALETIPEAMRTKEMSVFLEKLVSEREEFQQLLSTIKKRVQERDLEGLFEQVNRAVALQGNHPSLLKLQEQLGKLVEQRDDAYQEAERLLDQDNTKDALALLERVKLQELTPSQQQFKQQLHLMVDAGTELYACPQCHTMNDASRKFCHECAAPLRVSCLACEGEIPIWDKVCGECGGKQLELAAARKNELASDDLSLRTYSIHVGKISEEIRHVGDEKFSGVDKSLNIDESICEHYTQILFLIHERGYPVDLESILFTRDELMDYYKKDILAHKDEMIFDEDFLDEFPDKINSFIRNYCSPK